MANHRRLRATKLSSVISEQGRTKRWLAGRIGLSESYLGRIVNGTFTVGEEKGAQIAHALGVPLFLVFEFSDETVSVSVTELQ